MPARGASYPKPKPVFRENNSNGKVDLMKTKTLQKSGNTLMGKRFAFGSQILLAALTGLVVLHPARTNAQVVLWNESVNGDLSNTQGAPNTFTLSSGVNEIIGTVGTGDTQDWVTLTVPTGLQLSAVVLASYTSTDAQGFTGFAAGATFAGTVNSTGSYLGYSHFGTAAGNGSLPVANLVGADLLTIMQNPLADPGALGFTDPLQAGSYSFLIQQLGATTSYQFNYNVTATPEPGTVALGLVGGMLCWFRCRGAGLSKLSKRARPV
jgi:hypothetical protein